MKTYENGPTDRARFGAEASPLGLFYTVLEWNSGTLKISQLHVDCLSCCQLSGAIQKLRHARRGEGGRYQRDTV